MAAISTISISHATSSPSIITPPRSFSSSKSSFLTSTSLSLTFNSRTTNRKRGFSCNCIFGLGVPELVVIAGVAALVFGPKKLPEVGKSIGKTVKSFQQAAKEFESELKKEPEPEPEQVADPTPAQKVKEVGNTAERNTSSIKET